MVDSWLRLRPRPMPRPMTSVAGSGRLREESAASVWRAGTTLFRRSAPTFSGKRRRSSSRQPRESSDAARRPVGHRQSALNVRPAYRRGSLADVLGTNCAHGTGRPPICIHRGSRTDSTGGDSRHISMGNSADPAASGRTRGRAVRFRDRALLRLPATYRLPHDSAELVRPFYDFEFGSATAAGARQLIATGRGSTPVDGAIDRLGRGSVVAMTIPTPRKDRP